MQKDKGQLILSEKVGGLQDPQCGKKFFTLLACFPVIYFKQNFK
jgi:hypothetical protein